MPITLTNPSLLYSVYLPLALAVLAGLLAVISLRGRLSTPHLMVLLLCLLPAVATSFSLLFGYRNPLSFGFSAIISYWHTIWLFVSLPASIILGIIFAVIVHQRPKADAEEPDEGNSRK